MLLSSIKSKNILKLNYPLIVKPRFGRGSRGIKLVNNPKTMFSLIKKHNKNLKNWIAQDYIDGIEFTVSVVCYESKTNYAIIPKKIYVKEGITKVACTSYNYEIEETCKKIIKKNRS